MPPPIRVVPAAIRRRDVHPARDAAGGHRRDPGQVERQHGLVRVVLGARSRRRRRPCRAAWRGRRRRPCPSAPPARDLDPQRADRLVDAVGGHRVGDGAARRDRRRAVRSDVARGDREAVVVRRVGDDARGAAGRDDRARREPQPGSAGTGAGCSPSSCAGRRCRAGRSRTSRRCPRAWRRSGPRRRHAGLGRRGGRRRRRSRRRRRRGERRPAGRAARRRLRWAARRRRSACRASPSRACA